jgi:multifunctional beta-oxidation protein
MIAKIPEWVINMGDMLKGKVVVVTGAGNGLGRAHAVAMAAQGAGVVVNDLGTTWDGQGATSEAADLVVKTIKQAGGTAVANYDSIASEKGAEAIIQTAIEKFGRLDILVNNAGIIRNQPLDKIDTEDWDAVIKTHLYGTMFCSRAASRAMKKQQYGRIISTSSHIGFGFSGQATYSAVKEGIVGFCRSVARELGKDGITCNVIRPIAAWRGVPPERSLPAIEALRPEDISPLVVYLASEQADHINGCIFEVYRGHVGIFVDPPPVQQIIWKDGSWTSEELAQIIPKTLTKGRSREVYPPTLPDLFD